MIQTLTSNIYSRMRSSPPVSGGGLPAWITANAPNPGDWYEIPNTNASAIYSGVTLPTPLGTGGPQQSIFAWNSVAADRVNTRCIVAAAGGHNDYSGNEVKALLLNQATPGWVMLRNPTVSPTADVTHYSDGRPVSRHNYYGVHYDPINARTMIWGGARYSSGARLYTIDSFLDSTGDWSAAGTHPDFDTVIATNENYGQCIDPRNGNIYAFGSSRVAKHDAAANTTTLLSGTAPAAMEYGAFAFDTLRNRMWTPAYGGYYYSPDTNTWTSAAQTGVEAGGVLRDDNMSMTYCEAEDAYFFKSGSAGGTVYRIDASTFVSTSFTTSGGGSIPSITNCFQRFNYFPTLKGAVLVNSYTGNAWFLRIHA